MNKFLFTVSAVVLFVVGGAAFADAKSDMQTAVASYAAPDMKKIGVIDTNKIAMNTPQFKAIQEKFKKETELFEKEKKSAQESFQASFQVFKKNEPTMKESDKNAEQQKLADKYKKMQDELNKSQDKISTAQNKEMQAFAKKVEEVVSSVSDSKKLDLVVIKAAVAYSKPEIDISDEVINKLKKKSFSFGLSKKDSDIKLDENKTGELSVVTDKNSSDTKHERTINANIPQATVDVNSAATPTGSSEKHVNTNVIKKDNPGDNVKLKTLKTHSL